MRVSIGWEFLSINRMLFSIDTRFLFNRSKRAFNWSKGNLDQSRLWKTEFSAEFSVTNLNVWKRFQALWTVLWNILTLHTRLLMKYNLMSINREPNNLNVSWRHVCSNPLATTVWGQILSKDNNFVPASYLILFVFCVILVLPLLLCVLFPSGYQACISWSLEVVCGGCAIWYNEEPVLDYRWCIQNKILGHGQ